MDVLTPARTGTRLEVLRAFLVLGLTSFGGPTAHIGYFRTAFVLRRRWLDEAAFADLLALCQFLPGPASSQLGFALGVLRGGGLLGGLAAWVGFTLPSALMMLGFALGAGALTGSAASGALHGLKLVAVAIVAQAVCGMARTLTPDRARSAMALAAIVVVAIFGGAAGQIGAIALGALAGLLLCRGAAAPVVGTLRFPVTRWQGSVGLGGFVALLLVAPVLGRVTGLRDLALFDAFYRSGALVFGGGHVVLPLLRAALVPPGWLSDAAFLNGYGLAQAVPGPLFTVAAYLGAAAAPAAHPVWGAAVALLGVFLPGLLLVYGMLPFWDALRTRQPAQAAMRGANAAVVGILGAALYSPIMTSAVHTPRDALLALVGFLLLMAWKLPPWAVVVVLASAGAVFGA